MSSSRRVLVGISASVIALASCASEETSSSVPTLPPATATSTTTIPPTTSPTTSTASTTLPQSTTTATPTTAPPTTMAPREVTTSYFTSGGNGGWLLLGGHDETGWQSAYTADGTPIQPEVPDGSSITVSQLGAGPSEAATGDMIESCFDGRVGPDIDPDVAPPEPPGYGYSAIALFADWQLRPRPVAQIDVEFPIYDDNGAAIFEGDPVDATQGNIPQMVVADLDGDGDEESLVVFEWFQPSIVGAPGDFAAIFAVDTATDKTIEIQSNFVPPAVEGDDSFQILERYRILDVLDLDANGTMEVVVHSWYYEGAAVQVFEYDDSGFTEVLVAGCGS